MKRFRIFVPALGLAAVALAMIAGSASAHGGTRHGRATATPGVLEAEGDGIAAAAGKLAVHICAEDGILLAKGDVVIGEDAFGGQVDWLGLHVYFDFHGCADVGAAPSALSTQSGGSTGRGAALAAGTGLTLRAEGVGVAFLKGEGTWTKSNGDSGEWSQDGSAVKIGDVQKPSCEVQAQHGGQPKPSCPTPAPEPTSAPQ